MNAALAAPEPADVVALSLDQLRSRRSEKWSRHPADVLPAFIAEMDFAPPVAIARALHAAVDANDFGYAFPTGLGAAFADFAYAHFGWSVEPGRIFAAADVMLIVEQIVKLKTFPSASIVINPPVYPPFYEVIEATGRTIVEVPLLRTATAWELDFDALERAFVRGASAYLICSPHNPIGRVWSAEELRRVAALSKRYGVTVIADEIHSPLALDGSAHTPYLSVATDCDLAFAAYSASKAWNVAGLKCALAVAGSRESAAVLHDHWESQPTELRWRVGHLGVIATIAAFREGRQWLKHLQKRLSQNRTLLSALLAQKLPAAKCVLPQASFLAWIDVSKAGFSEEPADAFLRCGRVALSPGRDFGAGGAGFVRLNMGTSSTILTEIVDRMARSRGGSHGS
jgi:cysteine-S-conjugate beta-lyase